ncbi:MAG: MBL fold metallo-hydrolase [Rhodocyclaceae bacterium]|jgi:phosphoribosyl 1,2-cyclic phosphodiesterase|nr:putative metallo-hydrolase YycJ [Rhodocyclaceae bacterium]MBZ0145734.1 MBL fold metallo-hydrolase [Rhodocyclaceae bacterium]MCC6879348.1 MBL fold metallo-hydrolase [Rhodocyclaceae bacterium]MCL4682410.1 MBL fold metallo-hydrolase [Rhodocyclaceae bacterium]
MRFASLGSGSRGNALLVEAGTTRVLLDCGFGPREVAFRLGRLGLAAEDLAGILITHEHSDHAAGAFKLAARHRLTIRMTHGTSSAISPGGAEVPGVELIDSHQPLRIGDLEVHPFPVPHDAREPVQFVFSDGRHRLGVLSDLGGSTPHVERMLSGCDALVLECNHDADMLRKGGYPPHLKRRIAGRYGHLDNNASAALLAALDTSRLQHLIAAHLSQQNNTPGLARAALAGVLGCAGEWIAVADQETGFDWRDLR